MLDDAFFDRDACLVARALLGKVLRRRLPGGWVAARVVETEAYYRAEKASHASLGRTPSREATFMPAGTIYMYHSRAGDSLNVSCQGPGNSVLIKAGLPVVDERTAPNAVPLMQEQNPKRRQDGAVVGHRPPEKLCAGQTLLCKSLALRIKEWTGRPFDPEAFFVDDDGYRPALVLVTRRLGIRPGRDEHLLYRYVDEAHRGSATEDPLRKRRFVEGRDWFALPEGAPDPNRS